MRPPGLLLCLVATSVSLGCSPGPAEGPPGGSDAAVDVSIDTRPGDAPTGPPRCRNGVALPYPEGSPPLDESRPLPDLPFARPAPEGPLNLATLYTPCATDPGLLVIRVMAAWSGPARWHAAHTGRLRALPDGARLTLVDLLVRDEDNAPATPEDLGPWRALYDVPPDALAVDPRYWFRSLFFGGGRLPVVVLVDPRTMRPMRTLVSPDAPTLDDAISVAWAQLRGGPRPPRVPVVRTDGRFTHDQWAQIEAMARPLGPPPDPTNRWADDPNAARFGALLFDDRGLSGPGTVSCATCHDPSRAWADARGQGLGLAPGDRNTPSTHHAAHMRWLFWDGRADSLWSQALGPLENPVEMDGSRLAVAHRVTTVHRADYTAAFGPPPALDDPARFPPAGRPGQPAWDAMRPDDQTTVNRIFVNIGKALAAFERLQVAPETPFDRYIQGSFEAMTPRARDGLRRWFDFGCIQCHHGPLLTDQAFHNIGMPTGRRDGAPDLGRLEGLAAWRTSAFRADGMFSDAPTHRRLPEGLPEPWMRGAFRTPPLRGAASTGPWGHGGTFADLTAVMRHYATLVVAPPLPGTTGELDPHLGAFHMDAEALGSLADFLGALSVR